MVDVIGRPFPNRPTLQAQNLLSAVTSLVVCVFGVYGGACDRNRGVIFSIFYKGQRHASSLRIVSSRALL